ncbi:MAG: response regulator [Chloroflexota bacterium]|nr:response regulator [Chloroflexota bacterium]
MTMKELRQQLAQVIATHKDWTVLAIDNEPDNLALIQILLKGIGAHVQIADGGEVGLRMIENKMPSFVLLDLSMPTVDGWMVLAQIRANPRTAALPVVAVTAHAMPSDREKIIQAGFNSYIIKPYHIETLLKEILQQLTSASGHEPVTGK